MDIITAKKDNLNKKWTEDLNRHLNTTNHQGNADQYQKKLDTTSHFLELLSTRR